MADAEPVARSSLVDELAAEELADLTEALLELGQERERAADPEPAARAYRAVRQVAARHGSTLEVAAADLHLGRLYGRRGRFQDALGPLENAVGAFRDAEDERLGAALNGLGIVHRNLGQPERAAAIYREALELVGPETSPSAVAGRMHNLGTAYWEMGELELALVTLEQAFERKKQLDGEAKLCSTLISISNVRNDRGEEAAAEEALRECIDSGEPSPSRLSAMHNLGSVLRDQGRVDEGIELLQVALREATARGAGHLVLSLTQAMATLELKRKQPARALALVDELLAESGEKPSSDATRTWIFVHLTRAHALGELGRHREALEAAELAHRQAADLDIPDVTWQTWHQLGRCRLALGERDGAAEAFTAAIETIEAWRRELSQPGERGGFLHRKLAPYHRLLDLELERGRFDDALAVAERARARALADVLTATPAADTTAERTPGAGREIEIEAAPGSAVVAFTVTAQRLWIWSRPALETQPRADTPADTLADTRADKKGRWTAVPVTEAELAAAVEGLLRSLAGRDLAFGAHAVELGRLLLEPVAAELEGASRLVLVQDGPLWDVPFAALIFDGEPLVRRFALQSAPSLGLLAAFARRSPSGGGPPMVLGGADPEGSGAEGSRLDGAGQDGAGQGGASTGLDGPVARQAHAVAAVLGVEARLGERARVEQLAAMLAGRPRVLHVAGHGVADALHPARSYLQLEPAGRAGRLEATELAALDLSSAELVLLAACESGRGQVRRGEGMLGLTWATLRAGARNAVISHWRVDADATTGLMVGLHRRLGAGGSSEAGKGEDVDIAVALRASMLELADEAATAHPFYWAGFTVVGDGRLGPSSAPSGLE